MENFVTSMDQHGRVLIPSAVREMLNIQPGDKVNLEIYENEVKIISANQIIDDMHTIFTKNQNDRQNSIVDDFIKKKREEYKIEKARGIKNG